MHSSGILACQGCYEHYTGTQVQRMSRTSEWYRTYVVQEAGCPSNIIVISHLVQFLGGADRYSIKRSLLDLPSIYNDGIDGLKPGYVVDLPTRIDCTESGLPGESSKRCLSVLVAACAGFNHELFA